MLLMRAWGSRAGPADAHDARPLGASVATQKTTKKKPFTGGTRGSAALASGLILLRRRPEASKAIPGTTRAKRSAFARSFGDLALPDFSGGGGWGWDQFFVGKRGYRGRGGRRVGGTGRVGFLGARPPERGRRIPLKGRKASGLAKLEDAGRNASGVTVHSPPPPPKKKTCLRRFALGTPL